MNQVIAPAADRTNPKYRTQSAMVTKPISGGAKWAAMYHAAPASVMIEALRLFI
jgi:hypothetical protein